MVERDVFKVTREGSQLCLTGVVDEHAELTFLLTLSGPKAVLNLRGVRRINSYGVRAWLDLIRKVPLDVSLEFVAIPPHIVDQVNMVTGFLGRGHVGSFCVPYSCERCGADEERLVPTENCRRTGRLPAAQCDTCGATMEIDDVEEQYIEILREM